MSEDIKKLKPEVPVAADESTGGAAETNAEPEVAENDVTPLYCNGALPMVAMKGKVLLPNVYTTFDVGRAKSLAALNYASGNGSKIFVAAQKDAQQDNPAPNDIYSVGVVCAVKRSINIVGDNVRVHIEGLYRAEITKYVSTDNFFVVEIKKTEPIYDNPVETGAYFSLAREKYKEFAQMGKNYSEDAIDAVMKINDADVFVNAAAFNLALKEEDKQAILETLSVRDRLEKFTLALATLIEILSVEKKVAERVRESVEKGQKEFYLREQLKAIHQELGDDENEQDELEQKIKGKHMPKEVEEKALKELFRMSKMPPSSPDYTVLRTYLDWLIDLPFAEQTTDRESLAEAKKILDEDHFGLEKVKERIVEYLAVLKLTHQIKGPILCLAGPPGVGKTSVATSIARALGRKFVRMSLGGVKDEAEIRGHRKTYIGAMPGRIMYGLKAAGTVNPVFLLDEIDKISSDLRGDPASALLEVLDPEQNSTFRDRYLEIPYDLSKVLFITTANSLDTIPLPLLDRMEVIELNGYTEEEKTEIAKRYLVPKKIAENGLTADKAAIDESAVKAIIEGYTREAGVRSLEREIGSVARKIACKFAENADTPVQTATAANISDYLGAVKFDKEEDNFENEVGSATGLAWTAVGGTTLTIEVSLMHGKGEILLTGKLGDVMKESARAAISFIHAHAEQYGIDESLFEKRDIHIHVPEGATPKDGPSAGITMATALFSAFTDRPVVKSVAMTGEITLRGKVLPIGGLKEKSLAAFRAGINRIIIPKGNVKDLEEIPADIRPKIKFIPVSNVSEVFEHAVCEAPRSAVKNDAGAMMAAKANKNAAADGNAAV